MIRGFFFDLDGTLVDTHQANFRAYRRALEDFGHSLSYEQFLESIGHQAQTFLPWFAPNLSKEVYMQIADRKKSYYKEEVHRTLMNVKLVKFMEAMRPGHKIVLVTTAKRENAEAVMEHHKLGKYFDLIITAEDVKKSKPSPECYLLALKRMGLKPQEVLAFEDSEPGVESAEKAGIAVVKIEGFTNDTA